MGVIYKLNKEIVDFLITQKRKNPELTCRRLVEIVKKNFNVIISKSSINTVIKLAKLSAPVGRHSTKKTVPANKAISQMNEMPSFGRNLLGKDGVLVSELLSNLAGSSQEAVYLEKNIANFQKKEDPFLSVLQELKKIESEKALLDGRTYSNASFRDVLGDVSVAPKAGPFPAGGLYLLKAAEWEITASVGMPKTLSPEPIFFQEEKFWSVLFYAPLFGINSVNEFYQYRKRDLWMFCGVDSDAEKAKFFEFLNQGDRQKKSLRLPQHLFTEVSAVKICFSEAPAIFFDARVRRLISEEDIFYAPPVPIKKVVQEVSQRIVLNNKPIVLEPESFSGKTGKFLENVFSFLFGPLGQDIVGIQCLNQKKEELAVFDNIPKKKRFFLLGLPPSFENFPFLLESKENDVDVFCDPLGGKFVFVREGLLPKIKGFEQFSETFGMLLGEDSSAFPRVSVIANVPPDIWREALGENFFGLWGQDMPVWGNRALGKISDEVDFSNVQTDGGGDIQSQPVFELVDYCCQNYFNFPKTENVSDLIQGLLSLNHFISYRYNFLKIHFVKNNMPKVFLKENRLEKAICRINASNICSEKNQRLFLVID